MLVKAMPMLGKVIPILSVGIDVASIITTWTSSNETLEQVGRLKKEILDNVEALRQRVRSYQSNLEDQIGNLALQNSLRKLIKLRRSPPGPPCGPEEACKMLGLMQEMVGTRFLVFANLQGDRHEDLTENKYVTEIMPETDVLQLSQMSMCAPVVDSAYERFPDTQPSDDKVSRKHALVLPLRLSGGRN